MRNERIQKLSPPWNDKATECKKTVKLWSAAPWKLSKLPRLLVVFFKASICVAYLGRSKDHVITSSIKRLSIDISPAVSALLCNPHDHMSQVYSVHMLGSSALCKVSRSVTTNRRGLSYIVTPPCLRVFNLMELEACAWCYIPDVIPLVKLGVCSWRSWEWDWRYADVY
jgi:hypothetical protein